MSERKERDMHTTLERWEPSLLNVNWYNDSTWHLHVQEWQPGVKQEDHQQPEVRHGQADQELVEGGEIVISEWSWNGSWQSSCRRTALPTWRWRRWWRCWPGCRPGRGWSPGLPAQTTFKGRVTWDLPRCNRQSTQDSGCLQTSTEGSGRMIMTK